MRAWALALLLASTAAAEEPAIPTMIQGKVVDLASGKPVPGAHVRAISPGRAAATAETLAIVLTGADGTFRLPVDSKVDLAVGAEGYTETTLRAVVPGGAPLTVRLIPAVAEAGAQQMEVVAEKPKIDKSPTVSSYRIEHGAVDQTPGSLEDVTRAISLKPGIVQISEFAPVLYVRGGDAYQTFFFLDDVLIYNPFQPVGGGTIFNPDLVDSAEVYTGGQLASFPEALSGLISIQYKEPQTDHLHYLAEASAISLNGRIEGGVDKAKGGWRNLAPDGWLFSARRSDYEPLLAAAAPFLGESNIAAPVFLDLFAKGTWQLSPADRLEVNGMAVSNALSHFTYKSEAAQKQDSLFFDDEQRLGWARWTRVLSPSAFVKTNFSHVEDTLDAASTGTDPLAVDVSAVNDVLRMDYSSEPETGSAWDTGWYVDRAYATLFGRLSDLRRLQPGVAFGGDPNLPLTTLFPSRGFWITGAYVQYKRTLNDRLTVQPGVRLGWNDATQETNVGPRLNASWKLGEHHVVKGAFGIFSQPPINPVLLDPQFGNPALKSERAIHYVAGYEGEPFEERDPLWVKAELFYKDVFDQIEPQDFSTVNFSNPSPADIYKLEHPFENAGHSTAWGAEISLRREVTARTRLEVNYSLLQVITTNPLIADPARQTFAPYQDQRHTLNVVANYRYDDHWTFSATGRFNSGKPYTPVLGFTVETDLNNDLGPRDIWVPNQFGPVNSVRYPLYARVDLRAERGWRGRRGERYTLFGELINAQVRPNVEFIGYTAGNPDSIPPQAPVRQDIQGLPTLPYVGARVEW